MWIGTEQHKQLFCESFIASHRPYRAEDVPWPELPPATVERLRALPFWGEALGTERDTGAKITAYARTVADPLLREAIALQGMEEVRHAGLLEGLMARYEISAAPRLSSPLPADLDQAFVDAGYGECMDSFFAFGLFKLAGDSGFFPPNLLGAVEPIVAEEARHIVFFANWEAYHQLRRHRGAKALRFARALRFYVRAVRRRLGALRGASRSGSGFTASGAADLELPALTPAAFLETCLAENARRLAPFPPALLRPRLMPALARTFLRALRAVPSKGVAGTPARSGQPS
ncbi:MAG TPA: hypothetical protein VLU43_18415 [Anaeromyxobacteraceae bacterium]|nr:hypothetical protein [Anaeromyxobacteraceae bacterium]